jgi:two-component system LytT family response regulator
MNTVKISVKVGRELHFISYNDILVIKAENIYTRIYTLDAGCFVASHRMQEMETKLGFFNFFKTHRSYLVNLSYIDKYVKADSEIHVKGVKFPVPVARGLKASVEAKLQFPVSEL